MAASDVAGIPYGAGQPLAQLEAQVQVDPGAIYAIANTWTKAADNCTTQAQEVENAVNAVSAEWTGSAAQAFTSLMGRFNQTSGQVAGQFSDAAQLLSAAAERLSNLQTSVQQKCEELLTEVSQLEQSITNAKNLKAQILAAASAKTGEANNEVQNAETAIQGLISDLNKALSAVQADLGFSALPLPSGSSFDPPSGTAGPPISVPGGIPTSGGTTTLAGGPSGSGGSPAGGTTGSGAGTGGAAGNGGTGVPAGTPAAPAQVNTWIDEAIKILEENGVPASELNASDIWIIIQHESGGNPDAVNNWDSNAAAGTPSEGLMQTIGPTFDAYALPGHDQIFNPVDNIIAGVRYAISRYGSLSNVPGVVAVHNGQAYVGY
jgi:WXG100 family type VII secretion target